jgi:flagellar hook assembly protein FlgD
MSIDVSGARSRRALAALTGLIAATAVTVPAATADARGSNTGKAAALQQLQESAGGGQEASATAALGRQLTASRQPSARVAAATAAEPPATTPTDVSVTGTSGVVTMSATSSAPFVLFTADETPLDTPAAVTAGTATITAATWGWANGTNTVTAIDCADADPASCNTAAPASTTFDLENAAPQITAPASGAQVTGGFTINATSPGGGLRFLIDGTRRGFDNTDPYTFTYTGSALSPGSHVITSVQCSVDETRCDGPTADPVTISSNSLHPSITSVYPSAFSPNSDRYKDTTKVTYSLPDTETVYVSVATSHGTVVRGPSRLGTLAHGSHTWTWNGRSSSNRVVPSGSYRITLSTSATVHGVLVKGLVWRGVVVDNRAPSVTSLSYGSAVYPYRDGYKDALIVKFRINERAITTLTIRNSARHILRTLRSSHNAGAVSLAWNGRDVHGRMVKAGRYTWQLTVRDGVGNSGHTGMHGLTLSGKRLVSKSVTILRNGDSFASAGASDPSCGEVSTGLSSYPHGVWLANSCLFSGDVTAAFYHVAVPAAALYSHFTVQVYGWALYAPTSMVTGFGVHGGSSSFGIGGLYSIGSSAEGWYTIGSINAAEYISSTHRSNIAVTVTSDEAPCDFDVKQVRIKLSYKVLG